MRCPECECSIEDHRSVEDVINDAFNGDGWEQREAIENGEDPITCGDCGDCTVDIDELPEVIEEREMARAEDRRDSMMAY